MIDTDEMATIFQIAKYFEETNSLRKMCLSKDRVLTDKFGEKKETEC